MAGSCPTCGTQYRSKNHSTHHRRLCRSQMTEKVAAVLSMPAGLRVSFTYLVVGSVFAGRNGDGRYTVTEAFLNKKPKHNTYDSPEEAATDFLSRWDAREDRSEVL